MTTTSNQARIRLSMKPTSVAPRPGASRHRLLLVLAAAWVVLSLALGGAVTAETRQAAAGSASAASNAAMPPER